MVSGADGIRSRPTTRPSAVKQPKKSSVENFRIELGFTVIRFRKILRKVKGDGTIEGLIAIHRKMLRALGIRGTEKGRPELQSAFNKSMPEVLSEFLNCLDDLQQALIHAKKKDVIDIVNSAWLECVEKLGDFGVTQMAVKTGDAFDPNKHEAAAYQDSDRPLGEIVQVLGQGYFYLDHHHPKIPFIFPKVIVSSGSS
jgi:molecular chaperone GrpE (heat shock protein)